MFHALLVDDEESILRLFQAVLQMHGFEVSTASSAHLGIARLTERNFDVVVTDLRMETPLAGFDVVAAANQVEPRPVIVVLTAFPVPAAEWKRTGADALYVKGMNPLGLPDQLKALLNSAPQSLVAAAGKGR